MNAIIRLLCLLISFSCLLSFRTQCSIIIFAGIFPMKVGAFCTLPTCSRNSPSCSRHLCCRSFSRWIGLSSLQANNRLSACLALTGWTIRAMLQVSRSRCGPGIARILMETRSHAALPPMTPRLRFQVWVKGITPPSSSITSFPISRRAISPTDGLNAPVSEAAPDLSPRNSAPAPLCLSQGYKARTSIAR